MSYLEEGLKNSEVLKLDRIVKNIAVIGAGIVGICSAYFLKKSGFNVTLIDKEKPGTMTSFGHACSFADYANVPVNYPGLIWDCLLYTSPSPRDLSTSRMPSSA